MYEEISGARGEDSIRKGSLGVISTCPIQKTTELDSGPTVQKPATDDRRTHAMLTPICAAMQLCLFAGVRRFAGSQARAIVPAGLDPYHPALPSSSGNDVHRPIYNCSC